MGRFFETQPNPSLNFCTQPNQPNFFPDPTQPFADTRQFLKMFHNR